MIKISVSYYTLNLPERRMTVKISTGRVRPTREGGDLLAFPIPSVVRCIMGCGSTKGVQHQVNPVSRLLVQGTQIARRLQYYKTTRVACVIQNKYSSRKL